MAHYTYSLQTVMKFLKKQQKKQHQQAANAFKRTLHLSSSHVKFNEVAII